LAQATFYLAGGDWALIRRAIGRMAPSAILAAGAVGAVAIGATVVSARPNAGEFAALVGGYLIACVLWTMLGLAGLLGRVTWTLLPALFGLVTFVVVDRILVGRTRSHMVVAAAMALVCAFTLGVTGLRRVFRNVPTISSRGALRRAISLRDGLSYFLCGLFALTPIIAPHLLAWSGRARGTIGWNHAVAALELALVVSLLPVVVSVGVADRELRRFWLLLPEALRRTNASCETDLEEELRGAVADSRSRYMRLLIALTIGAFATYLVVALAGRLDTIIGRDQITWSIVAASGASIASVLLGLGAFNSMYALSLGQPSGVLVSLGCSVASVGAIGYPLALAWSWRAALPALVLATAVYALASSRLERTAMRNAAHLYTAVS